MAGLFLTQSDECVYVCVRVHAGGKQAVKLADCPCGSAWLEEFSVEKPVLKKLEVKGNFDRWFTETGRTLRSSSVELERIASL